MTDEQILMNEVKFEWGFVVNISDKTVDVIKSSYKDDDDDYGEDTIVKSIPWIEGYEFEDMMPVVEHVMKLRGYTFLEVGC